MILSEKQFIAKLMQKKWVSPSKLRHFIAMVDEFQAIGVKTSLEELLMARGFLTKNQVDLLLKELKPINEKLKKSPEELSKTSSSILTFQSADVYNDHEVDLLEQKHSPKAIALEAKAMNLGKKNSNRPKKGEKIGRYEVLGEIGQGGMATIYEVWDEKLRRNLAMKVLTLKKTNKKAIARFISEAQATSQLQHPNIIPIHDIGWTPAKLPFFTMDVVYGHSLDQVISHLAIGDEDFTQVYPRIRLLNIFIKICESVAFAHSKGVIHRDLKPQNIMVGPFGEVFIMDWGLAKFLKSSKSGVWTERQENTWVTQEGAIVGTPIYMPPEQAMGKVEEIDEQTDCYALGAVLYELLTFHTPFTGNTIEELYYKVINTDPEPPENYLEDSFGAKEIGAIALKALSREKINRHANVGELKVEVQQFLEQEKPAFISKVSNKKNIIFLGIVIFLLFSSFFYFFIQNYFSKQSLANILKERAQIHLQYNHYMLAKKDLEKYKKYKQEGEGEFFLHFSISAYEGNEKKEMIWLKKIISLSSNSDYHKFAVAVVRILEEKTKGDEISMIHSAMKSSKFDSLWGYIALIRIYSHKGLEALSVYNQKEVKKNFQKVEDLLQKAGKISQQQEILTIEKIKYYLIRLDHSKKRTELLDPRDEFYNEIMKLVKEVLKKMPKNGYLYFLKGKCHYLQKRFEKANQAFSMVKKLSQDNYLIKKIQKLKQLPK